MSSFVTRPTARITMVTLVLSLAWSSPLLNSSIPSAKARAPIPKQPELPIELAFEIATGVKMKFCWIPPGKATLGSPKEEKDRIADEMEHKFVTKGFWLGKYPVTQTEWQAVMGDNPSHFDGKKDNKAKGLDTRRFPVERVSWDDCQKFLEKLNKRDGMQQVFGKPGKFMLPHEDQWEYACRGGKGNRQAFYFGNELNGTQANCGGNLPYGTDKPGDCKERTTEVGSYAKDWPHPWGLCDMHGNVRQWCENQYEQSNTYTIRGGSWDSIARNCRSAFRLGSWPAHWSLNVGFRVCLPLEE
jgi:formylglycine-generating enzyme